MEMDTENKDLTDEIKKDIELIMRQTECYNINSVLERYKFNKCDVMETIMDILDLKPAVPKDIPESELELFRKIMEEKDQMYFELTNQVPKK
jgi:hypothetical protein